MWHLRVMESVFYVIILRLLSIIGARQISNISNCNAQT